MSESRPNSKPTLEQLLRLKRAERPTAEFWTQFETELRQKQLTALVDKRRWWHGFPVLLNRRVYLPAGAAAMVAFSLVAVRYTGSTRMAEIENTAPRVEIADAAMELLPATVVAARETRLDQPVVLDQVAHTGLSVQSDSENRASTPAAVMTASRRDNSPSARSIAANLAHLEQSEPELIKAVLGNRLSSPARETAVAVQADFEPGAATEPVSRYRLIARYADRALSPEPSAPALVRERIARRLGDDLGDGIRRIGVVGDRVSLKF